MIVRQELEMSCIFAFVITDKQQIKMMNKRLLNYLSTLFLSLCVAGGMGACDSGRMANLPDMKEHTALFDFFNYRGEDDFYEQNVLLDSAYFYNPILPGWYSDPSVCRVGEDYFMVTSTFSYFPGVPIFHSKDLVNWRQVGHVLDRPSQLKLDGQHISGGIYAPAISYNPHNKTYYVVTTNVGCGNFYVKAQNPFDEWSDPVMLPEVGGIDPSFFFDEDGKAYIVNNDAPIGPAEYDGHRTIQVQEFDWKNDKTVGPRKVLVNKGVHPEEKPIWIEGPHLYKINGKHFLMAAEGGTGNQHSEVVFLSDSPVGGFVPAKRNPILTQRHLNPERPNPITCAGHADLVQTKEGDWWAVFLACRPINHTFENLGRETFIMPVKWDKEGIPYMTEKDELIPMLLKRDGVKRGTEVTFGNFERNEDFSNDTLGMEWLTLRAPGTELYSLNEAPGYLRLNCAAVNASEKKTPAFIARRIQHHKFTVSTRMLFDPVNESEAAGILIFKDEKHQYFLSVSKSGEKKRIALEQVDDTIKKQLVAEEIEKDIKDMRLKVVSKGTYFECYYAVNEGEWMTLCKNVDASHLSTTNAGGFTGTTIGMYATANC